MQKGIYSSVIKYWDYLRQLNHDFAQSSKNGEDRYKFLNDPGLKIAEKTEAYYFDKALNSLIDHLQNDMEELYFLILELKN